MIYPYPTVQDEFATIAAVAAGKCLARFGDGELKLMRGSSAMREPPSTKLARELIDVLQRPHANLIVGVPTLDPAGPKYQNWLKHAVHFCALLSPEVNYYSAFVSRPDSAPAIENRAYAESVQRLWSGKKVVVVCEAEGFMLRTVSQEPGAPASVHHIECPKRETYRVLKSIHREVLRLDPDLVILSCGPAATVFANRLAKNGIHALDLGSAGRFLYRCLWPDEYQVISTRSLPH